MVLLLFIFCTIICLPAYTQTITDGQQKVIVDTVAVRKNSYIITKDSLIFVDKDTLYYVRDTLHSKLEANIKQEEVSAEQKFYEKLRRKLGKRKATKELFNLLFDISEGPKQQKKDSMAHIPKQYDGRIVGNIQIRKIDVFGAKVTDTTSRAKNRFTRFMNSIHVNTRDRVIRNNLLIDEGDFINQFKIADNERVLRALPFIRDARILIQPRSAESDTVDLLVLTQDVLSVSASLEPEGLSSAQLHLNDNNILGTGHAVDNAIVYEPDEKQYLGYKGSYQMPNIGGSFVRANLNYTNTNFENIYQFQLNRDFITPAIKYAGGAELSFNEKTTYAPWVSSFHVLDTLPEGTELPLMRYSYWYHDYWIARSFFPDLVLKNNRSRFTAGLRYSQTRFDDRPLVRADTNTAFHSSQIALATLGFSKRYYTTEQLVYTYGRTEDIPIGYLVEFTAGPHFGEFYNRFYTGLEYSSGKFMRRLGYFSFLSQLGGFWREGGLEEGMLQLGIRSFSYLVHWHRSQYRLFVNTNYTRGIRRTQSIDFNRAFINIRDENGIRGLSSSELEGNERLTLNLETVAYTPINLYGFRLAFFAFADIGWIAQPDEAVFSTRTYQGYGMGVRVRNENLAFKTFQIRLGVYPVVPNGEQLLGFSISNVPVPRFREFLSRKPDVFRFH